MRLFVTTCLLILISGGSLNADPIFRIDKGQGESALRLIHEGDKVRLYCKPCSEVVYSTLEVRTRELEAFGAGFRLLVNGEALDLSLTYVDDGFGDGWENLGHKLGVVDDAAARTLAASLDEVARLVPHAGAYAGVLDEHAIRLELVLKTRRLDGSYVIEDGGRSYVLLATAYSFTRKGETLALLERDADDRVTATWRAKLDGAAGSWSGSRTPLDGSEPQLFQIVRTANARRPHEARSDGRQP